MDILIPEVGESVREALVARWFRKSGDVVARDEPLCELETDKITLDLNADVAGVLTITVAEGKTVPVGTVIGSVAEGAATQQPAGGVQQSARAGHPGVSTEPVPSSPAARREMREKGIDPASVNGTGIRGKITLDDVATSLQGVSRVLPGQTSLTPPDHADASALALADSPPSPSAIFSASMTTAVPVSVGSETAPVYAAELEERVPMSPIRRRIAERLLLARQQTAMLTTFNEADMSHVKALRENYRGHFLERHGIALGIMPFFVRACIEALREFPAVNASIDGNDLVYHRYYDIGIAISGEKGLVVPVLRNADRMRMYEIDRAIADYSEKIKTNRLAISDLEGGTFTISNGGIFGSLMSTPIINPPQSAVLGMHAIQDRPVVREGQVVVRPMMYLALSYDHRIIDGREAVGFLKKVKEYIETPEELLLEG